MDFKYKIGDKVYRKLDESASCVSEHTVTSISFDKDRALYTCDNLVALEEKELYTDEDACKEDLKKDLQRKLDDLQAGKS